MACWRRLSCLNYIPSPNGSCLPPWEPLGWNLVNVVVITHGFCHNNCVFRENSSSPADYFARRSSSPSGGGEFCCPPSQDAPMEAVLLPGMAAVPLSHFGWVHSTAFTKLSSSFFIFLSHVHVCVFVRSLMLSAEMSKFSSLLGG